MSIEAQVRQVSIGRQDDFSITDAIHEIGRGRHGARGLSFQRARILFERLLADELSDLAVGAVLMAWRMKGESVDELAAGLTALVPWIRHVPVDPARPVVSIPSYNGSRKLANLTPLLACLLADSGIQVIVHGVRQDPGRVTTYQLMRAMGLDVATRIDDVPALLARSLPVFVPIDVLSPRLSRLLDLRWQMGVRNVGHTLAKLLNPVGDPRCLLLASYTHPEFELLQHELLLRLSAHALVSRGTEGEVFANPRRHARIDRLYGGKSATALDAQPLPIGQVMPLPAGNDVAACAAWMQSVLSGEREAPPALQAQVACVREALDC
ncbi:MAG: DNA-binding protein YbiB [Burkholderiaceae bacterium]